MSTAAPPNPTERRRYQLQVSSYDRASSLLLSLLVIVGAAVLGLLIVFFARQFRNTQIAIPVKALNPGERTPEAAMGLKEDIEPPGLEEAPELEQPNLQDTLNALANAVSTKQAILSDEAIDSPFEASKGKGLGDARQAGNGSGDAIREPRREMRFEPSSIEEYARFLDAYGIEIAVCGSDQNIYYASKLSQAAPATRSAPWNKEQRYSMRAAGPPLAPLDLRLARKAGISDKGPLILTYYPPETWGILMKLEQDASGGKSMEFLQFTAFRVTAESGRFTFSVEEQR